MHISLYLHDLCYLFRLIIEEYVKNNLVMRRDMNTFKRDKDLEKIVSDWMMENYFENEKINKNYTYKRTADMYNQFKGIDGYLSTVERNNQKVDEKVATSYIQVNIDEENMHTFAFELSSFNKAGENRISGWLFDQNKETELYLITWIWANIPKKDNNWGNQVFLEKNNILKTKSFLLERNLMHDYLKSYGINSENYIEKSNRLIQSGVKKEYLRENKKTPNIQYSYALPEKSVNVIICESHLENMALDIIEIDN